VPATSWIHGDLHPDQVLIQGSGASLLDMDALRLGAIEEDLASWAADMLAFDDSASLDAAVVLANLQDLYRTVGGPSVDKARLRALTIIELFERAAAAVRRLEEGAFVHASRLVAVARSITGQGS
jgi:aminoglycoside phosphotransferase (APT) family kinase protein